MARIAAITALAIGLFRRSAFAMLPPTTAAASVMSTSPRPPPKPTLLPPMHEGKVTVRGGVNGGPEYALWYGIVRPHALMSKQVTDCRPAMRPEIVFSVSVFPMNA